MASPRTRRLKLDYETLTRRFAGSPAIRIAGTAGLPPEVYRFEYRLKGIYVTPAGEILERDSHLLEVHLSLEYPRRAPQCRMLTPIFHPNIAPQAICIGDHWSAGQSLAQMVVHIAEMICYQSYNLKSPLNAKAAAWAEQNLASLPLFQADLSVGL